jgi:vancomycin resistance protein YoaR
MNSGLLITERQNHSYRVRYYEPAGTDATIYDPAPDFKFKNDTANWVLLTTKVVGDEVIFTYWGTRDGRVGKIGPSQISNIVPPPPKKTIETTDLPPGKVKCTEVAHAGATARVDYTVTYGNGETKKVVFTSVYRPWGAVCLVGATNPAPAPSGTPVDETGVNNPN